MLESREDTENISVRLGGQGGLVVMYGNHDKWEDLVAVVHDFGAARPGGLALPKDDAGTRTCVKAVAQFLKAFSDIFWARTGRRRRQLHQVCVQAHFEEDHPVGSEQDAPGHLAQLDHH